MPNWFTKLFAGDLFGPVKAGDTERVQSLLNRGASVSARDPNYTPLHWAAQLNHVPIVECLLKHKADVHASTTPGGWTPLHCAADRCQDPGKAEVVECLLKYGADVNAKDNKGSTPLHLAANWGFRSIITSLLKHGADPKVVNTEGKIPTDVARSFDAKSLIREAIDALTPKAEKDFLAAAAAGRTAEVNELLEKGISPLVRNGSGETALHLAAEGGHAETVLRLLQGGVEVNAKESTFHQTAVRLACIRGHASVVDILIGHGADKNESHAFRTLLHEAAVKGHTAVVECLLKHGADTDIRDDKDLSAADVAAIFNHIEVLKLLKKPSEARGNNQSNDKSPPDFATKALTGWTLLHEAAEQDRADHLEHLLATGANKDARDENGWTALHAAACCGCNNALWCLIEAGVDKEAQEFENGFTALHFGAKFGDTETLDCLLNAGAITETRSKGGVTALHLAAEHKQVAAINCLIEAGAEKDAKDDEGWTALHWAAKKGHKDVVVCLLDSGVDKEIKTKSGFTAFDLATSEGHTQVAELLK